ncbi:MAG: TonB-dependent receptor [Gammaproteobacteria bacterium]|nr:MAG: TonB-dependent receptor [Gammaproteobacteria bacterium]
MFNLKSFSRAFITVVPLVVIGNIAVAQVLEEIVVTATKREQSLQDVGIAITAFTGDQMEALGFSNAQQVTNMAPGVQTVQPNGEANYALAMRGVASSDFTTNVESPVAIYVDEVYISQMSGTGFMLFDMERVELLRGPQGTLFGRNATGGLAHFITNKPSQDGDGYAKLTVGDYSQVRFEGAVGGGIGDNSAVRLSASYHQNDGYITNRIGGKLNNADDLAVRLQWLYEPSDNFDLLLNARMSEQDIDTGFFKYVSSQLPGELTPGVPNPVLGDYTDNTGDNFSGEYDDPGYNDLSTTGLTATFNWGIGDATLTSITDVSTVERQYIEDSDASPVAFFNFFLTTDADQFSQELRLAGDRGEMTWVAGLYYLDLDISDSNGAITDPFVGPAPTPGAEAGLNNPYTSELQSISAFGQVEFPISESLRLVLGGRVINDDKDFNYVTEAVEFLDPEARDFNADSNLGSLGVIATYTGSRSDTEFAGRVQLDWSVSDDTLVYFSLNRGVKGGGYNAPIFPLNVPYDDDSMSFDPEQLDALEVGFKMTMMDGRARLNGAVYYYDYKDYQAFNIIGVDTLTFNADAESQGFELEYQVSPTENWDILLGAAYNDVEIDLGGGVTASTVQAPKWNFNALLRYEWPMSSGRLALQGDAVYRSEHFFALTAFPNQTEDGYTLANVSATYTSDSEVWAVSAFVYNVTDENYLVQTFDLSTTDIFGMTEQYYGRPRWWGVSFRYSWGG